MGAEQERAGRSHPLRGVAGHLPGLLGAAAELAGAALDDLTRLPRVLAGDSFGDWDPVYIRRTLPLVDTLLRGYFRPEVRGLEHVPADGPALLVGNHSGGLLIVDTFVFVAEFYKRFGPDRRLHALAHDATVRLPGLGGLRRSGMVGATYDNARRAFALGAPVLVYPGGDYETFRPSWHSDRVEFGGRKGFVRLALEADVPVVPVVSIGGQETALFLTRAQRLATALGLDRTLRTKVLPVALAPPFGVHVLDLPPRLPLPAKIRVEVLPAVDLRGRFGPRPRVDDVYDGITGDMQTVLSRMAGERALPLVG